MAFGDEKVVVNVKDIDRGEILYTDDAGVEHTYYPCHNIYLQVQTLEVLTVLGERHEDQEPTLVTRVRGMAQLEDRSISVVGDPKSKTRHLTISFEAGNSKPTPLAPAPNKEEFPQLSSNLGRALLSLNRADWEIGNDDEWWIACYLPKHFVDALVGEIRNGQLAAMKLSLGLRGLYTTEHSWAPISARGDLFIRPNRSDNTIASPDMATGSVESVFLTSAQRDLRRPEPADPTEEEDQYALPKPIPDPVAASITALGARVEQMRGTIKWIGGFIALAVLFLAIR